MFSPRRFSVSGLTFKPLIHFKLTSNRSVEHISMYQLQHIKIIKVVIPVDTVPKREKLPLIWV